MVREYIVLQLTVLLDDLVVDTTATRTASGWVLPDDDTLTEYARARTHFIVTNNRRVRAIMFLRQFLLPAGMASPLKLGDLAIRRFTDKDRMLFLSQHADNYMLDESFWPSFSKSVCVLDFEVADPSANIAEYIHERLNLLKLVLSIHIPDWWANADGIVLMTVDSSQVARLTHRILRDSHFGIVTVELSESDVERITRDWDLLTRYVQNNPGTKSAVWRFGRACSAPLSVDRLVESIIGMESLLVPDRGELGYRFRLHGTAILYDESIDGPDPAVLMKRLRGLYDARSSNVHGSGNLNNETVANHAVSYFARLIKSILHMIETGIINEQEDTAKAIERWVVDRLAKRARNGPS